MEWKTDQRLSPEAAFSHPFISKAVNELKCLRTTGGVATEKEEGRPAEQADAPPKAAPAHHQKAESTGQKQNNNSKNKDGNFSNGSGASSSIQPPEN